MANVFETPELIAKEALAEMKNEMVLMDKVDKQLNPFPRAVGQSMDIRRRVRLTAGDGRDVTSTINDVEEGKTQLVMNKQKHVAVELTSEDYRLELTDVREQIIRPAMIELVQKVEDEIATEGKNHFFNFTGTPGTEPATFLDIARNRALLNQEAATLSDRAAFYNPDASISLANSLQNVFPREIAKRAIEAAEITRYAGFPVIESNSLVSHTVGAYAGTPLVDGATQDVTYLSVKDGKYLTQTLITDGWTASIAGLLLQGDVITIAGVFAVNPRTRQSTGRLRNFVIGATAASSAGGNSTLVIEPAIIASGPYQTVSNAPADDAVITVVTGAANAVHTQNLTWQRNAITLGNAPLDVPQGAGWGTTESMDNISIRVVKDYNGVTDKEIMRFDILFGLTAQNPFSGTRHTS